MNTGQILNVYRAMFTSRALTVRTDLAGIWFADLAGIWFDLNLMVLKSSISNIHCVFKCKVHHNELLMLSVLSRMNQPVACDDWFYELLDLICK